MSFKYANIGDGELGDVTNPNGQINSYARIEHTASGNTAIMKEFSNGIYHDFANPVGLEVLILIATSTWNDDIGKFIVRKITDCADNGNDTYTLTFNDTLDELIGSTYRKQMISIPHFKNLTLDNFTISPRAFSKDDSLGGIIAFKCSDTLTLTNANINLVDKGLELSMGVGFRPDLPHESNGTLDTNLYAGCENSITKDRFLLNCGDGGAFIIANKIVSDSSSRIGNPNSKGVQYCRGASDSLNKPSGASNIGGSTILIVSSRWSTFNPAVISKYRTNSGGRGLARAYLAIAHARNEVLPDEGLYALDVPTNKRRLKNECNINGFGNGKDGAFSFTSYTNTNCFNEYARVTAVSDCVFTVSNASYFEVGDLVMVHQTRKGNANDHLDGKFIISRVVAVSGNTVTLTKTFSYNSGTYYTQMIRIPQFTNATISTKYLNTPEFNTSSGTGGICAIACNGTLNLSSGILNVEGKGTYLGKVNKAIGNASLKNYLPIGNGHGSVFILAKNLTMSSSTRIGATYTGANFGGRAVKGYSDGAVFGAYGGYKGPDATAGSTDMRGTGGWGGGAGTNPYDNYCAGGWFGNAPDVPYSGNEEPYGLQGAHILIVADKINNFTLAAISTGGNSGGHVSASYLNPDRLLNGSSGGAGYGGGGFPCITGVGTDRRYGGAGGYRGGGASTVNKYTNADIGGGGAGAAFIYCNEVNGENTTGIITL
ncbi:MAG: hypothetical protein IKT98_10405 [Selenomonadaceae bacterium]|nr:hypothetical protein [Selenomonadaceae bacterium]